MKTNPRPQGFSLVEVLIVMAILSIVMGALYATIFGSSSTFTSNTRMGSIQEDARRALDDLANEVRLADQKTLLVSGPTGGPNGVTFNVPTGIVAGVVTWSSPITYQLQPAAQMVQGAADSTAQNLVRIQTGVANGLPQRKCDFVSQGGIVGPGGVVSPQGLVITKTGTNLLITLTLTIQDENRKTLQTILTTSVTLRNSS